MNIRSLPFWILIATISVSCDSSSSPDYDDLTGSYSGEFQFTFSTVTGRLPANMTIQQTGAALTGTLSVVDEDGEDFSVSFTGTVEEGRNPDVGMAFRIEEDNCDVSESVEGSYTTAENRLSVSSTWQSYDNDCSTIPGGETAVTITVTKQ